MNEFDLKAAGWDQNPIVWDRAEAIANEIKRQIPLKKQMTALEFGAGTGVTSFILSDSLKEITLMDNSLEMVKVMNNKIKASGVGNLKTLISIWKSLNMKDTKFDFVFNQMVLHHINDIENIIQKFYNLLNPGGFWLLPTFIPKTVLFMVKDSQVIKVLIRKNYPECSLN